MYDANTRVSAGCRYVRVDFTWEPSGHISAVTHLQAIPDVSLTFGSTRIDQMTLAAFVLLVLLTCTQAFVAGFAIWHRLTAATSVWKIFLVGSPQDHLQWATGNPISMTPAAAPAKTYMLK